MNKINTIIMVMFGRLFEMVLGLLVEKYLSDTAIRKDLFPV
jgi:hypothetical protein